MATVEDKSAARDVESQLRDPSPLWGRLRAVTLLYLLNHIIGLASFAILAARGAAFDPQFLQDLPIGLGVTVYSAPQLPIFVLCGFFTCWITYRMMSNLHKLRSPLVDIGPIWSFASYFVPIASLFVPVQAVGEIWRGTFAELDSENRLESKGAIGLWWAALLVNNILALAAVFIARAETSTLSAISLIYTIYLSFSLIWICLFLNVFGKLAKGQAQMVRLKANH